jgi:hypothetical protein
VPDPLPYFYSIAVAAAVSVCVTLALLALGKSNRATWLNAAAMLALGFGLVGGFAQLDLQLNWPPISALERLLLLVLPSTMAIELVASFAKVPRAVVWALRIGLAIATPRVLLHGSVYLSDASQGTRDEAWLAMLICGGALVIAWQLLLKLNQRRLGISLPLTLSMALASGGMTVMMAGYIKGGSIAMPFCMSLVVTTLAARWMVRTPASFQMEGVLSVSFVSLFGLLFVGHFFGRISIYAGLAVLLAPLLCWVTETRLLRDRRPWQVGLLRFMFGAIPLSVVLLLAYEDFQRDMLPLLSWNFE